jgi:hypothetical protein
VSDERATFRVGDAQALPVGVHEFDASVAGLVINFVPDQRRALAEMRRATKPGGTVAAYVWDYVGEMQMMRQFWDAAVALNPPAKDLDEGVRFPVCQPDALQNLFHSASLERIVSDAIDVPTVFRNFDDYWRPFLGGQAPAPGYCMSLSEGDRAALRERLRGSLPIRHDGTIHLIARAWAVKGRVGAGSRRRLPALPRPNEPRLLHQGGARRGDGGGSRQVLPRGLRNTPWGPIRRCSFSGAEPGSRTAPSGQRAAPQTAREPSERPSC